MFYVGHEITMFCFIHCVVSHLVYYAIYSKNTFKSFLSFIDYLSPKKVHIYLCHLLYEYRDLFIDMAVRNNRSELAIANRHQER